MLFYNQCLQPCWSQKSNKKLYHKQLISEKKQNPKELWKLIILVIPSNHSGNSYCQ